MEEANRYIYGAYFNMARDNFLNTIKLLADKMKLGATSGFGKDGNEVNDINELFGDKNTYANIENVVEFYFPWIKALEGRFSLDKGDRSLNDMKMFYKSVLTAFFTAVDSLRNKYTHYSHKDLNIREIKIECTLGGKDYCIGLLNALDCIYDSAVNLLKLRFMAGEDEVAHLRRCKAVNKKVVVRTEKDGFYYRLSDNGGVTEKGVIFIASMFLNRKYGFLFLKQLEGFKRSDEKRYRLTLEAFLAFSNIKPVDRLKSDKLDRASLGLDMLNELTKIPKELSETLSVDCLYKYLASDGEDDLRSRIRYQDRFVPLALEFISQSDEFKDFRFYTYVGNYVYKGYIKRLIDGTDKERYLSDRLCGFYKSVNDASSDAIAQKYGVEIKDSNEPDYMLPDSFRPHVLRATPHFVINNNNIGIKICGNDCFPVVNGKGVESPEPDYWLSIYELPAMLFYAYLREKNGKRFKDYKSIRELIEGVEKKADEKNDRDKGALMARHIDKEIIWTQTKLDEVKRLEEKKVAAYGKKGRVVLKSGRMADLLAHDMVRLQPATKGSDKITGANFQALQVSLAYFKRDILADVFSRAMLTTGNHRHPFLYRIDVSHCSSLRDFYVAYLGERRKYFEDVAKKIAKNKLNTPCHILRRLQREGSGEEAGKDVKPKFLPRGIFTDSIKNCLEQSKLNIYIRNARNDVKPAINAAYLILMYYKEIEKGEFQGFYGEKRRYDILEEGKPLDLAERKKALASIKPAKIDVSEANMPMSKEEHLMRKRYHAVCNNESAIRMYQVQDILLLLMAKDIFKKALSEGVMSKKIGLENLNGIFDAPVNFVKNFDNIKLTATGIKIKDYGKVCRLGTDFKFNSLIKAFHKVYSKSVEMDYSDYLKEEEEFEKYRLNMVKLCREVERGITEDLHLSLDGKSHLGFNDDVIKPYNDKYNVFNGDDLTFFINARNMFMHGDYKYECVKYVVSEHFKGSLNDVSFAKETYGHFCNLLESMRKKTGLRIDI